MRNSRRILRLVSMAALTVLMVALVEAMPAVSAPAAQTGSGTVTGVTTPQVSYYRALFQNRQTKLCLESNSAGTVYTRACNSRSTYQQWRFDNTALQYIWNVATGRCLQYVIAAGSATGLVSAKPCNRADYHQLWKGHITGAEFTYYSQHCLDSNSGGAVYNLACNGSGYQLWNKVYFDTP
ncbi:RICIN domain-containing protein [Kribbella ginsengisoli]|uniref:Ricin B lectin domain-containing protein n=1 Tax=Kribbella ginsengisoli TaxID=363865 RepID=A0ABP6YR74_9ACTN